MNNSNSQLTAEEAKALANCPSTSEYHASKDGSIQNIYLEHSLYKNRIYLETVDNNFINRNLVLNKRGKVHN